MNLTYRLSHLLVFSLLCFTGISQILNLPARSPSALTGFQFEATIASSTLSLTNRENMIYSEVAAGNIPNFYRTMVAVTSTATISGSTQSVTYYVIPDYLAIGCDTDYFLCPMSPMLATRIGNLTGTTLPTRKMVNDIWQAATVHMSPQPLPAGSQMSTVPYFAHHDSLVDSLRQTFIPPHSLGELTGGDKKDVVISNMIYTTANRVVIYGWHYTSGSPIQPMTNVHADTYMDYSHGIRLVQSACMLNGSTPTTVQAVLQSSTLNPILSDEGVISQPYYPYGVSLSTPQSFALLRNTSTSLKLVVKNDPQVTHYNVYKSTNGTTFGSPLKLAKTNLVISGLTTNQLCYVKISSFDSVNNVTSSVSEVLSTVPSSQNDSILIVNGFDRSISGNTYDFVRQHGASVFNYGKYFESCTNEAVTDNLLQLSKYRIVDWILGEESTTNETFSNTEQSFVTAYLQQGGELFTSGSEIGWDLDHSGTTNDKAFYNNYLKASYVMDAPNNSAGSCYASLMQPLSSSIFGFADTVKFDNGTHGTYNVNYPDVIAPLNGSVSDLRYTSSSADIACVHFAGLFTGGTKSGKLVYLAYPFETIYSASQRDSVMFGILDFFYANSSQTTDIKNVSAIKSKVYPNPTTGNIMIEFAEIPQSEIEAEIFDLSGKSLNKQTFEPAPKLFFENEGMADGIYLLKISTEKGTSIQRISIIK
ncbi:MAG: T9SS type A sorting domain-containing protein [Bacteroidia bacterium]